MEKIILRLITGTADLVILVVRWTGTALIWLAGVGCLSIIVGSVIVLVGPLIGYGKLAWIGAIVIGAIAVALVIGAARKRLRVTDGRERAARQAAEEGQRKSQARRRVLSDRFGRLSVAELHELIGLSPLDEAGIRDRHARAARKFHLLDRLESLNPTDYKELIALAPDRATKDEWGKRYGAAQEKMRQTEEGRNRPWPQPVAALSARPAMPAVNMARVVYSGRLLLYDGLYRYVDEQLTRRYGAGWRQDRGTTWRGPGTPLTDDTPDLAGLRRLLLSEWKAVFAQRWPHR